LYIKRLYALDFPCGAGRVFGAVFITPVPFNRPQLEELEGAPSFAPFFAKQLGSDDQTPRLSCSSLGLAP